MPTFLLLIYGDPQAWEAMTEQEEMLSAAGHEAFQRAAGDRLTGGHEIDRSHGVTSLRPTRSGGVQEVEGPLETSHRVLGGWYVVQADDRAAAVALAGHLREAHVEHSGVEVRQVLAVPATSGAPGDRS